MQVQLCRITNLAVAPYKSKNYVRHLSVLMLGPMDLCLVPLLQSLNCSPSLPPTSLSAIGLSIEIWSLYSSHLGVLLPSNSPIPSTAPNKKMSHLSFFCAHPPLPLSCLPFRPVFSRTTGTNYKYPSGSHDQAKTQACQLQPLPHSPA